MLHTAAYDFIFVCRQHQMYVKNTKSSELRYFVNIDKCKCTFQAEKYVAMKLIQLLYIMLRKRFCVSDSEDAPLKKTKS